MKLISALLIALVALPMSINMAASYIAELKVLIPNDQHAFINVITNYFSSEPVIMLLIGICLIGISGIGRKKLSDKDTGNRVKRDLKPIIAPYPEPVPWKKAD